MQLLTRYPQAQSSKSCTDDGPAPWLAVFAEGFSLHAGVSVSGWTVIHSNDSLATALVRRFHSIVSPWTRTARSLSSEARSSPAHPGGCTVADAVSRSNRRSDTTARSHLVPTTVFAPHSRHRARIVPTSASPIDNARRHARRPISHDLSTPPPSRSRLDWASLLRRVFAIVCFICDRCGGRRQLLSMITEAKTAQKILNHLGMPAQALSQSPPERPHLSPIQPIGAIKRGRSTPIELVELSSPPTPPTSPASPTSPLPSACPPTHHRHKHLLFSPTNRRQSGVNCQEKRDSDGEGWLAFPCCTKCEPNGRKPGRKQGGK